MSKKFKLLALTLACVTTLGMGMINAFASAKTKVVVEDSFNDLKYEGSTNGGKWVSTFAGDPSFKQSGAENPALQFVAGQSGCESVQFGTKNKIENIESVSFSVKMPSSMTNDNKNSWMAINFFPQLTTTTGNNAYHFSVSVEEKHIYGKGENTERSAIWGDLFPEYIEENGSIFDTWVSIKIVPTSETTLEVYAALRATNPEDTVFPSEPVLTVDGIRTDAEANTSFKNAYVLFGCEGSGSGVSIDDIKIVGSNMTVEEDFTSSILNEEIQAYPSNKIGTALKIVDNNTLQISNAKAGDRVIAKQAIEADTSIAEDLIIFEASFNVKMHKSSTDEIAFVFGLPAVGADPLQSSNAYVIGKNYGKLVKYVDGEVAYETPENEQHKLNQVTATKGADISIKIYKDGSVDVYENGVIKSSLAKAEGYAGFYGFATLSDTTGTTNIDNVVVRNTSYYVPVTKSVTHNFSNDFFGNAGFEDFVITGTSGRVVVEDGKLFYDGCADDRQFGSAHQYDSFIMDYQLCSIDVGSDKTKTNNWIGLDIGRSSANLTHYGTNIMLAFYLAPAPGVQEMSLWSYVSESSTIDRETVKIIQHKPIPTSLVRDIQFDNATRTEADIKAGDALCVRWVSDATNENLKLYLKKACESEFTLYAEVRGVNTSGYQAICCTGWTSFKIDNFSMSNTSPIYEIANNEVPETIYPDPIIKEVYTAPDVDVNWEEELKIMGTVNGGNGGSSKGCKGSVAGSLAMLPLALIGALVIKKKNH